MSHSKSVGPAAGAAATLPVTGPETFLIIIAGVAIVLLGLLLLRFGRPRRNRG